MKIKVMLEPGAYCPQKAHPHDAGYDLFVPITSERSYFLRDNLVIDTGVHIDIPKGYYFSVENRSGLNFKHSITLHGTGTIDSGYTGSIGVKLYNDGAMPHKLLQGDRIAQLIIHPYTEDVEFVIVESLDDTERGNGGFGSTGR